MKRIDELGALNRAGKRLALLLAPLVTLPGVARALGLLEAFIAVLQGKGSGSGWDLGGEIEVAARLVARAHPVILDIGANQGAWTRGMYAQLAHLQPRFLLFEPAAGCQPALRTLTIPNSAVLPVALGERRGEALLRSDAPASEAASLYRRRESYHQAQNVSEQLVPIHTVDAVLAAYAIPFVDFMKIDVEGHELAVLRGALGALQAGRIGAIAFEFGSGQINARAWFHDFWDLLHPLGYRLYRVLPGGKLLAVTEYYESLEFFRGVSNYVALLAR